MNNLTLTIYNKEYYVNEKYYSYDKLKNGYIVNIDLSQNIELEKAIRSFIISVAKNFVDLIMINGYISDKNIQFTNGIIKTRLVDNNVKIEFNCK
jgi:hypothetical protein